VARSLFGFVVAQFAIFYVVSFAAHDSHPDVPLCLGDPPHRRILVRGVEWLEPSPRLAIVFKCAILAAGGAAIANQLLP
jgi:hypothetical protein